MRLLKEVPLLLPLMLVLSFSVRGLGTSVVGGDFVLTDQDGNRFQLQQLRGRVVLLFFGYTYCPDICPTELTSVAAVLDALEEKEDRVQGLFVSVDPERDTPAVLKNYIPYFNAKLIGLTGTAAQIAAVAEQYRVRYRKHQRDDGRYTMDHSALLYVIDPMGALVAAIPYGLPAEHILNVVEELLATRYEAQAVKTGEGG